MKNFKKYISTLLVIIMTVSCMSSCSILESDSDNWLDYYEGVENYEALWWPIMKGFFPQKIPSNSQVESFSYYSPNHKNTLYDIYLELKFNTVEETGAFVDEVTNDYLAYTKERLPDSDNSFLIYEVNPYNEGYTDIICTFNSTMSNKKFYVGYKFEKSYDGRELIYKCTFQVISYSYEEKTVILSHSSGWFLEKCDNYIPRYFLRFNVPIENGQNRIYYV